MYFIIFSFYYQELFIKQKLCHINLSCDAQHVVEHKKKMVNDFLKSFISKNCFNFTYPNVRTRVAAPCKSIVKRNVNACKFCFYRLFH